MTCLYNLISLRQTNVSSPSQVEQQSSKGEFALLQIGSEMSDSSLLTSLTPQTRLSTLDMTRWLAEIAIVLQTQAQSSHRGMCGRPGSVMIISGIDNRLVLSN